MRRCAVALASLAAFGVAEARADTVESYYLTKKLVEKSHAIDVTVHPGWADLVVRRSVLNGSEKADQASFVIELPPGAAAVGLRTKGTLGGEPTWFAGELLDAETAGRRYFEFTGIGPHALRDPALLSWRALGALDLQVFPCAPHETKEVEYTLRMPTSYAAGRVRLRLPALGTAEVPAVVTVHGDGELFVDERALDSDAKVLLDEAHEIGLASSFGAHLRGELGVVPIADERALVAMSFDVEPRLSEVPSDASLVILVDGSRSVGATRAKAELAAASVYLENFVGTGAKAAVVTFDRVTHDATDGLVGLDRAAKALESLDLGSANGSNIDAAFARARAIFAEAPDRSPRRIILLSDLETKAALDPGTLAKVARMNAVLHVATVSDGSARIARDDEDPWAKLPRSTGGVLYRASIEGDTSKPLAPEDRPARRAVFLPWARPVALERVALSASGIAAADLPQLSAVGEGEGIEDLALRKRAPQWIRLDAELWSTPVHKTLKADEAQSRRWAGMLFGNELMTSLKPKEMTRIATWGGAVSPKTSFLAIEPGVRPSVEGLERGNMWGDEIGDSFGAGGLGISGIGEGGGGRAVDFEGLLRGVVSEGVHACGPHEGRTAIHIETTSDEIVDVAAHVEGEPDLGTCIEEAVWSSILPSDFREAHARYEITL